MESKNELKLRNLEEIKERFGKFEGYVLEAIYENNPLQLAYALGWIDAINWMFFYDIE